MSPWDVLREAFALLGVIVVTTLRVITGTQDH